LINDEPIFTVQPKPASFTRFKQMALGFAHPHGALAQRADVFKNDPA
jgi:hypothetical protein